MLEVIPDAGLLRSSFQIFPRRRHIKQLQAAIIDNPSIGNYEELGDLYLEDQKFAPARECLRPGHRRAPDSPDPFYRRAPGGARRSTTHRRRSPISKRSSGAIRSTTTSAPPVSSHTRSRRSGQADRALALFAETLEVSTLSETQCNYAALLANQGRKAEARQWAETVLRKKLTMPSYLRRRERPWFRKAAAVIKRL